MQDRLRHEVDSLRLMHAACPTHTPEVYDYDAAMCALAMQYLAPPHEVCFCSNRNVWHTRVG